MFTFTKSFPIGTCFACVIVALSAAACSKTPSQPPVAGNPDQAFSEAMAQAERENGDVDKAAAGYIAFVDRYPQHELTPNVLMRLGDLYHNEADALMKKGVLRPDSAVVAKAAKAYDEFLQRFPNDPQASNVLMKKGLLYQNAGNAPEAVKAYDAFLERFPNDPQADNVRSKRDALR